MKKIKKYIIIDVKTAKALYGINAKTLIFSTYKIRQAFGVINYIL